MIQRVISGEGVDAARRWEAPDVGAGGVRPRSVAQGGDARAHGLPTAEHIEEIERQAREEGYRKGLEEGRKAAQDALACEVQAMQRVLASLVPSVEQLDAELQDELLTLAMAVARQLVRRELRTDPGQIVGVVREALGVLPSSGRRIRLHLHPEDARIVREAMHVSELDQPWQIFEDPTLSRGGARLETETSRVDATLETRLNAVIAEIWGERRDDERPAADAVEPVEEPLP
jgi:flagellar assembly protein FliH